jgi:IS30 family transposase
VRCCKTEVERKEGKIANKSPSLRTRRVRRRPQRRLLFPPQRIRDKVMISQRPLEVADRAVAGHWEGDLIVGQVDKSYVGTLVERTTRFAVLLHLPGGPSHNQVIAALAAKLGRLPTQLHRSVTWDQGIEMINHLRYTGIPVYIAEARSPWQRGANENPNGLLRQYLPRAATCGCTPGPTWTPSRKPSTSALDRQRHSARSLRSPLEGTLGRRSVFTYRRHSTVKLRGREDV